MAVRPAATCCRGRGRRPARPAWREAPPARKTSRSSPPRARLRRTPEPDRREAEEHADIRGDPFAAAKAEPDREEVPMKAPKPATAAAGAPQRQKIRTGTVAFRRSPRSVSAATFLLPVRRTLVAPILPEPIDRRSPSRTVSSGSAEGDGAAEIADDECSHEDRRFGSRGHGPSAQCP